MKELSDLLEAINEIDDYDIFGHVIYVSDLVIKASGLGPFVCIGSRCEVQSDDGSITIVEVTAVNSSHVTMLAFFQSTKVKIGDKVRVANQDNAIYPDPSWKGRVINALGEPIDGKGPLKKGKIGYNLVKNAPPSHSRNLIGSKRVDMGVKIVNSMLSCCSGQRMGIFAGSGVGKSVLISMFTRFSDVDFKVIGLVGERGREVQEFLQEYLGEEGLKNALVVVSTSDESSLMRKYATYMTITIAEYFRDMGEEVLCMIDSMTRFAMAQREIGLISGEPVTTKGYTPSVFLELPRVLERAGPGVNGGANITGIFSVLVEGSDMDEPIADAIRGILDGHMVLDREIAERGRYPSINILRSISRMMPKCNTDKETKAVGVVKKLLSTYENSKDMIALGMYKEGSDKDIDLAIKYYPVIEDFFTQKINESYNIEKSYELLFSVLSSLI